MFAYFDVVIRFFIVTTARLGQIFDVRPIRSEPTRPDLRTRLRARVLSKTRSHMLNSSADLITQKLQE